MSLVDKLEIKRSSTIAIGMKIEEMLEGAERKVQETSGAKKAMQVQVKNLMGIMAAVDDEVEKSIPDLETAKLIKTWLGKTVASTENLAGHLGNVEMQAIGEVAGYKATHDLIQKLVKEIDDSKVSFLRAIDEGRITLEEDGSPQMTGDGPRLPGVRPGLSIAQQRKAEEEEAVQVAKLEATEDDPSNKKIKRVKGKK